MSDESDKAAEVPADTESKRPFQFSIRSMMIVTAVIGSFFALATQAPLLIAFGYLLFLLIVSGFWLGVNFSLIAIWTTGVLGSLAANLFYKIPNSDGWGLGFIEKLGVMILLYIPGWIASIVFIFKMWKSPVWKLLLLTIVFCAASIGLSIYHNK